MGKSWYRISMSIAAHCYTGDCQSPPGVFSPNFPTLRMCSWFCWLPVLRSLLSSSASLVHVWTRHTTALHDGALHSHSVFAPLPAAPEAYRAVMLYNHSTTHGPATQTSDYQLCEERKKKARMYTINHAAGKTNYMFIMYDFTCFTAHFNDWT